MKRFEAGCVALGIALGAAPQASAAPVPKSATEQVLWSFKTGNLGYPLGRLLSRGSELYGTASAFGDSGNGQVFELRRSNAKWAGKTIVTFDGTDGSEPFAGLISSSGTLYGTAALGVSGNCGSVFSARRSGGAWHHNTVWTFTGGTSDGCQPLSDLAMDGAGNIYGTTAGGGGQNSGCSGGCGAVFELSPGTGGSWSETLLHDFTAGTDGAGPRAGLYRDGKGNLFGTTSSGGGSGCLVGCGIVFELSPKGSGWTYNIIHTFTGSDGGMPWGVLIEGKDGTLYSTTTTGGSFGDGAVYSLAKSKGAWSESVLYSFRGVSDGGTPQAALVPDGSGGFYGTAFAGGQSGCYENVGCGVVFRLTNAKGGWSESVLYSFSGGSDGGNPSAAVILDASGNLYSTSYQGGAYGYGTVWEVTP